MIDLHVFCAECIDGCMELFSMNFFIVLLSWNILYIPLESPYCGCLCVMFYNIVFIMLVLRF